MSNITNVKLPTSNSNATDTHDTELTKFFDAVKSNPNDPNIPKMLQVLLHNKSTKEFIAFLEMIKNSGVKLPLSTQNGAANG